MRKVLKHIIVKLRAFLSPYFTKYRSLLPYIVTIIIALIVVIGCANLFVELTAQIKTEALAEYDQLVTDCIVSYRNPILTNYFRFVTEVGDVYGYLIILLVIILLRVFVLKNWKYISQIIITLALASISNVILKRFISRARPDIEHLVVVKTLSYPSGHAMSAMAFYGFLAYLIYTSNMNKGLKFLLIALSYLLIFSIGLSRIYLGVHFPSDILGGFIAGMMWAFFCILIFNLIAVFKRDPLT